MTFYKQNLIKFLVKAFGNLGKLNSDRRTKRYVDHCLTSRDFTVFRLEDSSATSLAYAFQILPSFYKHTALPSNKNVFNADPLSLSHDSLQ